MEKKKSPVLTPRLQKLADWVEPGAKVADIGTDHGYLPVWLLTTGRTASAIGSDLRAGPLDNARKTAARYAVSEKISLRLGDGLNGILPSEVDTLVIAGMGGENIASILAAAPWAKQCTLLLQPMSRSEILREFLEKNGYAIEREALVEDRGTLYPVMLVRAGSMTLTAGQRYGGACLLHDPLEDRYLIEEIVRMQSAIAGVCHSSSENDVKKADALRELSYALMKLREEWRNANSQAN
jgi:tRNA (adenine22-N1)-methyltransferase